MLIIERIKYFLDLHFLTDISNLEIHMNLYLFQNAKNLQKITSEVTLKLYKMK